MEKTVSGTYGSRFQRPLGVSSRGWAGAGENLGIEALAGDTDMVTVFDDFNGVIANEEFGGTARWETMGWVLTDVGTPANEQVGMNDAADVDVWAPSCIRIFTADTDDTGGNMQLDRVNASLPASSGGGDFPHLWIPETAAGTGVLDNTIWTFACRIGLRADLTTTGSGDWDSKAFIGWAEAGDTGIMTAATGVITITSGGPIVGFHIPEDGSIDGISHRTVATAMAEGTNFTELHAAGAVDGTTANGYTTAGDTSWWDLALRMQITDQSDDSANGWTTFYSRRVPQRTSPPGSGPFNRPGQGSAWARHSVVLNDQTPNNDVALVPTIEVINGPTAGRDGVVFLDWWSFGVSRFSR